MKSLGSIRDRLSKLAASLPTKTGKPLAIIFAQKYDPENPPGIDENAWEPDTANPGKSRHPLPYDGVETPTYWPYKNAAELEALHERFDRLYGPGTRNPNDLPALFIRLISREEIADRATALAGAS